VLPGAHVQAGHRLLAARSRSDRAVAERSQSPTHGCRSVCARSIAGLFCQSRASAGTVVITPLRCGTEIGGKSGRRLQRESFGSRGSGVGAAWRLQHERGGGGDSKDG